jgi:hypothetical protein
LRVRIVGACPENAARAPVVDVSACIDCKPLLRLWIAARAPARVVSQKRCTRSQYDGFE